MGNMSSPAYPTSIAVLRDWRRSHQTTLEQARRRFVTVEHPLGPNTKPIRARTLEDISAEKFRALLQQPIRNRSRPQDVYDIASRFQSRRAHIDIDKLSHFVVRKSAARDIDARKRAFDDRVRQRASEGYEAEIGTQATQVLPFEKAWSEVLDLVARLSIPK